MTCLQNRNKCDKADYVWYDYDRVDVLRHVDTNQKHIDLIIGHVTYK